MKTKRRIPFATGLIVFFIACIATEVKAQEKIKVKSKHYPKSVLIQPVIETDNGELIFSREHLYKKHLGLGDQLARDFMVVASSDDGVLQFYENDGKENKDYLSWRKNVLAPVSGRVTLISHPDTTNNPGVMNREAEPGRIYIKRDNGSTVSLVHVREIRVNEGQMVTAGEVVAKVGNNGNSVGPHIHVGAWKGETPLQIQVDLYKDQRK